MLPPGPGQARLRQLQDGTGASSCSPRPTVTDARLRRLQTISLGDWIGVTGEVMKTKRGELSVKVTTWSLLAEARRRFPDKWHGLSDTDTRYRQRYVDLWANDDSPAASSLRSEARGVSLTRRLLEDAGFIEVETPVFHPIPGGAMARPFTTHHNALDVELFLRIAPELYLKRLVVGGFERVFEFARVFRNEGLSHTATTPSSRCSSSTRRSATTTT